MEFNHILFEVTDGIAQITLNRPEVRNALNAAHVEDIQRAVRAAAADPEVQVLIFTGAGDKAFAAGADINGVLTRTPQESLTAPLQGVLTELEEMVKPSIAAVNGFALGGGCELSMACDIRIAAENARFGQPEVNLGILAGAGGTQRLARLVGLGRAKELLMTGDLIDAQEAYRIGLVNKVVPVGEAVNAARDMAKKIMSKGPLAVRMSKLACQMGSNVDLRSGLLIEKLAQAFLCGTEDKNEGASAFLQKRTPEFKGR